MSCPMPAQVSPLFGQAFRRRRRQRRPIDPLRPKAFVEWREIWARTQTSLFTMRLAQRSDRFHPIPAFTSSYSLVKGMTAGAFCVTQSYVAWQSQIKSPSLQSLLRTIVFVAQRVSFGMVGTCGSSLAIPQAYSWKTKKRQRRLGDSVRVCKTFVLLASGCLLCSQGNTTFPFP